MCRTAVSIFLVATFVGCRSTPSGVPPSFERRLPTEETNSTWWRYNDGDTVFIFVHGILSNSRRCWYYEDKTDQAKNSYWPELVANDVNLHKPAVYLAGYYADVDSAELGIRMAARAIERDLSTPDAEGQQPPLSKRNLVFVAHSLGGNVVRYLLENATWRFADKTVGIALVASPAGGSAYADWLSHLVELYRNEFGQELAVSNKLLSDLDGRFRTLVDERRIEYLAGIEATEHHFVVHRWWLPGFPKVVPTTATGGYFGTTEIIPKTDHFSIAKPSDATHRSHRWLVGFITDKYAKVLARRGLVSPDKSGRTWQLASGNACTADSDVVTRTMTTNRTQQVHCLEWTIRSPRSIHRAELTAHVTRPEAQLLRVSTDAIDLRGAAPRLIDQLTNGEPHWTLASAWCDARESASIRFRVWLTTPHAVTESVRAELSESDPDTSSCDILP